MFVFRNYTIENLFDEDVQFSGYGDISEIPKADAYMWFYNVPIGLDRLSVLNEIRGIGDKLQIVTERISSTVSFYIFTLEDLFPVGIQTSDNSIEDAIKCVNNIAREISEQKSNVRIINFREFLQLFNPQEWINWKFYFCRR